MRDLRFYPVNGFNRLVRQPATTLPMREGKRKVFNFSGNIINFSKTSKRILKHYKNRHKCQSPVKHEIICSIMVKPVRRSSGN